MDVVRLARDRDKTGLWPLGQEGGQWATTAEEASHYFSVPVRGRRLIMGSDAYRAAARTALPKGQQPFYPFMWSRKIHVPSGTKKQAGLAEAEFGMPGGAVEYKFLDPR